MGSLNEKLPIWSYLHVMHCAMWGLQIPYIIALHTLAIKMDDKVNDLFDCTGRIL